MMEGFNVKSVGITRREFTQAVHRLGLSFYLTVLGVAAAALLIMYLVAGYNSLFILFPGSIALALLLYYELKAQGNYGKFDYEGVVFHFRFEPDRWVVIRGEELSTRGEFLWSETRLIRTGKNLLLVPKRRGTGNYTLPKRSLTEEQMNAILVWQAQASR